MLVIGLFLFLLIRISKAENLIIEQSGLANINQSGPALIFFIQVREEGTTASRIQVDPVECCETLSEDVTDCNTITLVGGDMGIGCIGKSRNLTLFFPTLYAFNRHGSCLVDIYHNSRESVIRHRLDFDTIYSPEVNLESSNSLTLPNGAKPCDSLDQNPLRNCDAVQCSAKYYGLRNFYNVDSKICETAPICDCDSVYVPLANKCRKVKQAIQSEEVQKLSNELPMSELVDDIAVGLCHHGFYFAGACICEEGWTSERLEDTSVDAFEYCNIPVTQSVILRSSLRDFILHALAALPLVLLILMLIYLHNRFFQRTPIILYNAPLVGLYVPKH